MAWINERYAGEVAVVFTWLLAVSPWAVTWFRPTGITAVAFRFLPFRALYIFGTSLPGERPFIWAWEVAEFQIEPEVVLAGHVGIAALTVMVVAIGLSIVYYAREEALVDALPVHPVRVFGALHALLALLLLVATGLFFEFHPGTTVPVGAALAAVFAYLLLRADLAPDAEPETGSDPEADSTAET